MQSWKRLLRILALTVLGITLLLLSLGISFTDLLVDFWWHDELGLAQFFWLKLLYRYIISGTVTAFFFFIFFLNFWAASQFLGVEAESFEGLARSEINRRKHVLKLFQQGSLKVYLPLSVFLAVGIAVPFYHEWQEALLFIFGPESGVREPVFGRDVSFYLFSFPIYKLVQVELLFATTILSIAISILYTIEHSLSSNLKRPWANGAKTHLSALVLLTALVVSWGFMLERYELLYTEAHEPQFYGPGFLEIRYYLPIIWVSIISLLGATLAWIYFSIQKKRWGIALVLSLVFLSSLVTRHVDLIPNALERFVVSPNPVKTEREFMKNNIDSTLDAYGLTDITNIDVDPGLPDEDVLDPELRAHLYNIPVWDPEFLDDVYQQMQGIRPYYRFTHTDVARYMINGRLEQVNLAAREVNISLLPETAQNWENIHMRYSHGYGAVVSPASQDGQTPMNWYLQGLDMQSDSFKVERPDIYYGEEDLPYAIVPNKLNIVGIPSIDEQSSFNYSGRGGVPISSLFRKLLFSTYFGDEQLFFSVNVSGESRALFHRNIIERVKALTPFLKLDEEPYIVITPRRIFWVIDAFTTSEWYPLSKRSQTHFHGDHVETEFNYIRDSVKVIVDAFDGHVDFYAGDNDPIALGFKNAYPGLFKNMDEMPPELLNQLRYPKDLFISQMKIYARYHQREPELFFEQAETWDFARVNDAKVDPYYLTTALEDYESDKPGLVLIEPMTPVGRSNLSVLAVGGTFKIGPNVEANPKYDTQIVMYRFNREMQVDGPAQVSSLIDQAPDIARQLTLWDQRGSRVLRGRIIVLPVGHSVLYVQPVYIVSTSGTRIPELQRIILSMGNVVVMSDSLESGISELERQLKIVRDKNPSRAKPNLNFPNKSRLPSMQPTTGR